MTAALLVPGNAVGQTEPPPGVVDLTLESAIPAPAPENVTEPAATSSKAQDQRRGGTSSHCNDGLVCFWSSTGYSGSTKVRADCSEFGGQGYFFILGNELFFNSAKNRCNGRKVEMATPWMITRCLDANEEDPTISDSDRFRVGGSGSNC